MPEKINEEVKTTKAETPKKEEKPKTSKKEPKAVVKTKRTRTPVRPVEELRYLPLKKLTEKEKDKLLEHQKELLSIKNTKIEQLENTCHNQLASLHNLQDQYDSMEKHYTKKLNYIHNQATSFNEALRAATLGGIQ